MEFDCICKLNLSNSNYMKKIFFTKVLMLAFVLSVGYGLHQAEASDLFSVPTSALAQEQGWKHIDSEYYSFDVPEGWQPYFSTNDGVTLSKRVVDGIVYSSLAWKNDAQSFNEYEDVKIQSVENENGENLSLKEGKKLLHSKDRPKTKTLFKSENEICFKSVYESKNMFGNMESWTSYYYYRYDGKRYYEVSCSSQSERYKVEKDLEERYLHIIRSFKLKTE